MSKELDDARLGGALRSELSHGTAGVDAGAAYHQFRLRRRHRAWRRAMSVAAAALLVGLVGVVTNTDGSGHTNLRVLHPANSASPPSAIAPASGTGAEPGGAPAANAPESSGHIAQPSGSRTGSAANGPVAHAPTAHETAPQSGPPASFPPATNQPDASHTTCYPTGSGARSSPTTNDTPSAHGVSYSDPGLGPSKGGTQVVIHGWGLSGASVLRFDSTSVAFTVASDSEIDAVTPAHDPGYVAITVTFPNGESTSRSQAFEYQPSTADIAYVAPPRGPASGGTSVRICLAEHTPVTGVLFGSTPATSFTSDGSQQIDAVSPPGSPGTVDIRVTNNDGTSSATSKDQYTYTS